MFLCVELSKTILQLSPNTSNKRELNSNDPKFLDRLIWTNSEDPDQTAPGTDRSGQTVKTLIRLLLGQTDLSQQWRPWSDCSWDRQIWANNKGPDQTAPGTDRSGQTVKSLIRLLPLQTELGKQWRPWSNCSWDRQIWADSEDPDQTAHGTDSSGQTVDTLIRLLLNLCKLQTDPSGADWSGSSLFALLSVYFGHITLWQNPNIQMLR